jgi:superfamily II DNA/RNA helicase
MDLIQEAIEYLESHEAGDNPPYRKVAEKFGVDRTTLSRRRRGARRSNEAAGEAQQLLNPQQELELVRYIEKRIKHGFPPTREMVQNFGSAAAQREVSESWVARFLHRHSDQLTTKWSAGIDRERHDADRKERYEQYFALLYAKMREYKVNERNTYNMDEKGFFVGREIRSKRVFTKRTWASKERTAALKDGNREWITLLACVCASGEALPPALMYQGHLGFNRAG